MFLNLKNNAFQALLNWTQYLAVVDQMLSKQLTPVARNAIALHYLMPRGPSNQLNDHFSPEVR